MIERGAGGRDALEALRRGSAPNVPGGGERRRQRLATVMAVVGIAGVLAVGAFMFRRPPESLVLADCRDAYARSPTAADSVLTDGRFPATPNGKPWPVSCGALRRAGRLVAPAR